MKVLCTTRSAAVVLVLLLVPALVRAQTADPAKQSSPEHEQQSQQPRNAGASAPQSPAGTQSKPQTTTPAPAPAPSPAAQKKDNSDGQQTKRMFWVIPNFAAVSANAQLPPLSAREKFVIAMHDSVDYSSFVWSGMLAAQSMALRSYPELRGGAAGYGRYYWRAYTDQASGAFFTEALVPAVTHEDPRYYTLGHGGFFRRTEYALFQVVSTKTDSGGRSFNVSEILGNGMEAGLANTYYPPQERGLRKTAENWGTGLESAALNNLVKEFWPDIRHKILRQK